MQPDDVVITGLGAVTPIGATVEDFWKATIHGIKGIRREERMDLAALPCGWNAGIMPDHLLDFVYSKWGRTSKVLGGTLANAAILQAVEDAGISAGGKKPIGFVWARVWPEHGSTPAEYEEYLSAMVRAEWNGSLPTPLGVEESPLSDQVVKILDTPIVSLRVDATCAGGLRAIVEAIRLLQLGKVDVAIVAAGTSRCNHYTSSQYAQMMALSKWKGAPEDSSMPFDRRRSGMVINESAGALVLETRAGAERRRAKVLYASIKGWGLAAETLRLTAPSVDKVESVIRMAIDSARLTPKDIDAINAHATSTRLNDVTEASALHRVFGEGLAKINVSAVKSLIGHGSAASGITETVISALTLKRNIIPPVVTTKEIDPECNLNLSTEPIERPIRFLVKNSFGFGGQYASIVLSQSNL